MESNSIPGGKATVLTFPCNPPSAASSVYAASEASTETMTTSSAASFATNSTIGDYNPQRLGPTTPIHAVVPREANNTLPSNPNTNTPLPLLQFPDGDTLLFINPPPSTISPEIASLRMGATSAPLRVISSKLLSSGSRVFEQLLSPQMQQRIFNRLIKQKKMVLPNGKLPPEIRFVLDLTPEDEGEMAVEWQEKLWCPDLVLRWKSSLVDLEPLPTPSNDENLSKKLEEFRQEQWGQGRTEDNPSDVPPQTAPRPRTDSLPKKENLPEPYSFGRHVLALERLIHILHGVDPLVQHTVDWYTLHCLSVAFGTTDATRDYIARWIFANSLIIETHPALIWRVSVEAGLATLASDAFAAAVMRYNFDPAGAQEIPGATDAALSLADRARRELVDLTAAIWVDQYLPPQSPGSDPEDQQHYEEWRSSLKRYISLQMESTVSGHLENVIPLAMTRNIWLSLQNTRLCSDTTSYSPTDLFATSLGSLQKCIFFWEKWEASVGGETIGNDDLWRDVKLGAPQYPLASVTQQTTIDNQDAQSEIVSQTGTNIAPSSIDDDDYDVRSMSSTHTLNQAMGALNTERDTPLALPGESSSTLVDQLATSQLNTDNSPAENKIQGEIDDIETTEYGKKFTRRSFAMDDEIPQVEQTFKHIEPSYPQSDPDAPEWLRDQLEDLSSQNRPAHFWALMHHPNGDTSRPTEPRIRCLDCPDMLYFAGPGETLHNFRVHLRNVKHMNRLQSRKASEIMLGYQSYSEPPPPKQLVEPATRIPNGLVTILRFCETYVRTKCAEMSARNIVFEPILLEEQLACLEESERVFMPLWSGGEEIPSKNKAGQANRGVSDSSANEDMTVNVSSVGISSTYTDSSTDSFINVNTPASSSDASVIGSSDSEDLVMHSSDENEDDWVMDEDGEEDDSFEDDDDIYFG
ncbi:hypothetical protein TWF694_002738 [Orbilia ellipsospora]|uniref:Uncharacterized protein n=1 Tax=Orbilia ellipsospora TaxID=2528407 RepID=A0AAV9X368_9PEZI